MMSVLVSTNPADGYKVLGEVAVSSLAEVQAAVEKSKQAHVLWAEKSVAERVQVLRELHDVLLARKSDFVHQTSEEMGMTRVLSEGVFDSALETLLWNCDHAQEYLNPETTYKDADETNVITYEPYGVMACVVAWNFPFGNFILSTTQALLAGNTVVMKYSEEVPLFSKLLERVLKSSSLPENLIQFVYGAGDVGQTLVAQDIDFISFTGSSAVGKALYKTAAEKFIPVALELGGSSPCIIFEGYELSDALIEKLFWLRFNNNAQFCDNMKRLIVHESLFDDCVSKLKAYAEGVQIGNPLGEGDFQMGPLVAERQVAQIERQLQASLQQGATLVCGGKRPQGLDGAYFEPTLLVDVTQDMTAWREELFGPVLPIVSFSTYEEAIALANDTDYGLTAMLFSPNEDIVKRAGRDLKAGSVKANNSHFYRPQNPFGGYKASGMGRQGGACGFHEFCQVKVLAC